MSYEHKVVLATTIYMAVHCPPDTQSAYVVLDLDCGGQDIAHESEQIPEGSPRLTGEEGFLDPTERLAAELGLDWRLLSHKTGLLGTDANGATSRLRFMLAHLPQPNCYSHSPRHRSQTKSSALKQQRPKRAHVALIKPPEPASPLEQQV